MQISPHISEISTTAHRAGHGSSMGSRLSEKKAPHPSSGTNGNEETPILSSTVRTRFASLVRAAVLMRRRAAAAAPAPMLASPGPQLTRSESYFGSGEGPVTMKSSRVAEWTERLKRLEPAQDLPAHQALVCHMQFSPDGKFLATCSLYAHQHITYHINT
jgi:WD repeat-containing protein 26